MANCLNCNSINLVHYREITYEERRNITRKGTISKRMSKTDNSGVYGAENVECEDCGCVMGYAEEADGKIKLLDIV